MPKRITLTLAAELLDEVAKAKPKALSLSTWCALLVEQAMREATTSSASGHSQPLTLR
jgi:hypothetical protein